MHILLLTLANIDPSLLAFLTLTAFSTFLVQSPRVDYIMKIRSFKLYRQTFDKP